MLFEGERISWTQSEEQNKIVSDSAINEKYISGEVRIVTEQARYPLDTIKSMVESNKYELMPAFQRRHRWDNDKKSRLIESFIMNVPIPPIFLYENEFSYYEVMDGLQRVTTICDFYSDKFQLSGLERWPELNGKKYSELPEKIRQGIDRRYLSSIILLQESAKDETKAQQMKQLVFERINSGGIQLEPQETRNALYNGRMNCLCAELSRNKYLCLLFNIPHKDLLEDGQLTLEDWEEDVVEEEFQTILDENPLYKKMTDVELVLRFFALRNIEGYSNQFNNFLDRYLIKANEFDENLLNSLKNLFVRTIEFAYNLFGKKAFYLLRRRRSGGEEKWFWYERSTTTVYDPLMYVLSDLLPQKEKLLSSKEVIREEIAGVYQAHYDVFEGRNSNRSDIEKRICIYTDFFRKYI